MNSNLNSIGRNIRFLRRARNWTLEDLSSRIGIHKGPLGRIERGMNLPSAAVIYNLSTALNVSIDTLFSPDPLHQPPVKSSESGDTCFISLEPDAISPPRPLLDACCKIMTAFHALEDLCQVPKYARVPLFIPFSPCYGGMEDLAARLRTYLSTGDAVVFDYFELFENAGLRVVVFPFPRGTSNIEAVSFYESTFHNAFFFLNSRNNSEKQLFSLARELGKILISNQIHRQKSPVFPPTQSSEDVNRPFTVDRAARRFASTFLMPEPAVRATVSQLGASKEAWSWELLLRIKHRFGVSAEAFLYRLHELDLISDPVRDLIKIRIKAFYAANGLIEPDSTRRSLSPNGRFFDLLLTAETKETDTEEIQQTRQLIEGLKIVIN